MHLRGVGQDVGQVRLDVVRQLDAGGNHRAEQVDGFEHHRPELDGLLLVRLRTAEGEDALDQVGGAMHRAPHLAQVLLSRMRLSHVHRDEREVAANRGQQVVEVVGDAAGERAHRLHLLRLPQLRFEPLPHVLRPPPLRDAGADVAGEPAVRVEAGHGVRGHPAELAVGALQTVVHLERRARSKAASCLASTTRRSSGCTPSAQPSRASEFRGGR